jgi:hypothetical protein
MQASSLGDAEHSRPVVGVIVGAVLLLAWPVTIALARHDGAPVGADTPVYVWWARLVGAAGSSSVAMRPGLPSVTATVSASLGVPETVAVAGLGCALVAMVGLCGGALLRAGGERSRTALIGLGLTGLFAGYLASGHLSNAASAALFVLALAFVLDARPRSIVSASLLLGAAGLAHPDFLWVALSIVLAAVAWSIVGHERREAVALAVSGVVGAAVAWLGLMAASAGGSAFDVPTSLDVFLMQTDQLGRLHALFLERFRPKVAGYALWVWIPLSALAARRLDRPLGRLLLSWVGVTIVGVVVGLVWQPFPPHRIVAFAMCLPLLAAIGTAAVAERAPRYAIWIIAGVIVFVAATATIAWVAAPRPFRDPSAVLATAAAAQVAQTPSGPTVVDLPDDANRTAVAVIRWTNLLRAAVPPDRIRDVVVRFPPPSADDADQTALWLSTEAQIRDTFAGASIHELPPITAPASAGPAGSVAALLAAATGWIAICGIVGSGWTYAAGLRGVQLLERSVGVGMAGLILAGSLVGRTGSLLGQRSTAIGLIVGVGVVGGIAAIASRTVGRPPVARPRGADPTRTVRGHLLSFHPSGTP